MSLRRARSADEQGPWPGSPTRVAGGTGVPGGACATLGVAGPGVANLGVADPDVADPGVANPGVANPA